MIHLNKYVFIKTAAKIAIIFSTSKKKLKKALFSIKYLDMLGNMVIFALNFLYNNVNIRLSASLPVKVGLLFSFDVFEENKMCKIKKGLVNDIFFVIKLEIVRKSAIFAANTKGQKRGRVAPP